MAYTNKYSPFKNFGLTVEVRGNFERSMRTFTKKVQNSGILKDLKDKEHYEKPSAKRKRAKAIAQKREQKRRKDGQLTQHHWE